jgi:hypothetical protein
VGVSAASPFFLSAAFRYGYAHHLVMHSMTRNPVLIALLLNLTAKAQNNLKHVGHAILTRVYDHMFWREHSVPCRCRKGYLIQSLFNV